MNSAPTSAPQAVPTPPNSDAPPMTAAAIALSSYKSPASGPAERSCPVSSTAATPPHRPQIAYAPSFTAATGTPESRAASSLPPTA